jgi:hypothetical protein
VFPRKRENSVKHQDGASGQVVTDLICWYLIR